MRKDLKLVISSATLDAQKFAHFFNAKIFNVDGRVFPVEEIYCPLNFLSYVNAAANQIREINEREDADGDILVFMTGKWMYFSEIYKLLSSIDDYYRSGLCPVVGQKDIEELCENLHKYENSSLYRS